jgi:hypothetical protein
MILSVDSIFPEVKFFVWLFPSVSSPSFMNPAEKDVVSDYSHPILDLPVSKSFHIDWFPTY